MVQKISNRLSRDREKGSRVRAGGESPVVSQSVPGRVRVWLVVKWGQQCKCSGLQWSCLQLGLKCIKSVASARIHGDKNYLL
jgi:hypothetical protein